jgi:hypothetical protein
VQELLFNGVDGFAYGNLLRKNLIKIAAVDLLLFNVSDVPYL